MRAKIGDKIFTIKVADTDDRRRQGLKGIAKMPKEHGLMLKFGGSLNIPITMNDMKFPIGLVYILDGEVQGVTKGNVGDKKDITINKNSDSVLELNVDEVNGIKVGDTVELIGKKEKGGTIDFVAGEEEPEAGKIHVLNDKGQVQANLEGSERVFSRKDTTNLIDKAKRAEESKTDSHYISLGRAFVRVINRQDSQEPEYVKE